MIDNMGKTTDSNDDGLEHTESQLSNFYCTKQLLKFLESI